MIVVQILNHLYKKKLIRSRYKWIEHLTNCYLFILILYKIIILDEHVNTHMRYRRFELSHKKKWKPSNNFQSFLPSPSPRKPYLPSMITLFLFFNILTSIWQAPENMKENMPKSFFLHHNSMDLRWDELQTSFLFYFFDFWELTHVG